MSDLFFYGTLRHVPLLEIVLGRQSDRIDVTPAILPEYAVHEVQGQPFPMIFAEPGRQARGLLVRDLSAEDVARLIYYEGGFAYDLEERAVRLPNGGDAPARLFLPEPGKWQAGSPWSLEAWAAQWAELSVLAAEEVMDYYGRLDVDEITRNFPAIRLRAWARIAAKNRVPGADARDLSRDVNVERRNRAYVNYFGVEEMDIRHRQNDGTMGPVLNRTGLMTGQAAAVLPYDPVRDAVLLIEQFRAPVFMIGDPDPWIWEPVAGMIDPGETPEEAAYREMLEEAHVEPVSLEPAGKAYSSTGSSTEFMHLFVGLADLTHTVDDGGLASEGEDIRSRIIPFSTLVGMVDTHQVKNLQLLTLAHWLRLHRPRLRGEI